MAQSQKLFQNMLFFGFRHSLSLDEENVLRHLDADLKSEDQIVIQIMAFRSHEANSGLS